VQKIEEAIWVLIGGTVLVVMGWRLLLEASDVCGLRSFSGCFINWPLIPVDPRVNAYYNLELGWYLHLMLKHVLGVGLADGSAMNTHHMVAVVLIIMSYMLCVHRLGLFIFALLNLSTPLLHASKLANLLVLRQARVQLFTAFSAMFFISRVLIFPVLVLKGAMLGVLTQIRGVKEYFLPYFVVTNILLVVLWVMQMVWFVAILRILKAIVDGSDAKLQEMVHAAGSQTDLKSPCSKA